LDLQDWFELRAMLATAEMVVTAALARTESRGAHQREDFPDSSAAFEKNQVLELKDGELRSRWVDPIRLTARGVSHV
jgi:succinate dehydrogenase/fumarate reductase flavoprotein subunit